MSSDPPIIHRLLGNAWKSISLPRSQHEDPSSVTRMRSFTIALFPNHDSDHLPLYANAAEMEKREYLPSSPFTLSQTIVGLTFQAVLAMYLAMLASQGQQRLVGVAMVIGFASSFSVSFIKHSYPRVANIAEKIGFLSSAMGFFLMTRGFFSGSLITWIIGCLTGAMPMLAFLISCLT